MIPDVRTMGLISGLMPFVLGCIMMIYWWERKTYGGFGRWVLSDFAFAVGYLLISLRGMIGDFASIILGNIIAVYAEILIYEGTQRFYNRRVVSKLNYTLLACFIPLQVYYTYINPNINARTALVSFVLAVLIFRTGLLLLNSTIPELNRTSRRAGYIFLLTGILPVIRITYALRLSQPIDLFSDPIGAWLSLIGLLSILLWTFYFFLLNSARLELDLEAARAELEEIASTDPLTGLYNRRHFFEHAGIEFQRAKRHECELSFLLIDADDFKLINDSYGHNAGDTVMTSLASIFEREIRAFDLVARYGGDEFVIMLVDVDEDQAFAIAERIRDKAESTPMHYDHHTLHIQLSIGISTFTIDDPDLTSILKRADVALYHAKEQGRNRVRVA